MPAQPKTGDVRGGRDAEVGDGLPGDTVETSAPALQQRFAFLMIVPACLDACSQDARAQRLGQQQTQARPQLVIGGHMIGIDDAGHGHAVLEFVILHRMPAGQHGPGFFQGIHAAAQDIGQDVLRVVLGQAGGEKSHVHGTPGLPAQCVDIRQGIAGRDAAEPEGIVDDGRQDVHGLHDGLARRHAHDHGILVAGTPGDDALLQIRRSTGREAPQKLLQGPWSHFCRSAGGPGLFQQLHDEPRFVEK